MAELPDGLIAELRALLGDAYVIDSGESLETLSKDYYWYSPVLKRQLEHIVVVVAVVVVVFVPYKVKMDQFSMRMIFLMTLPPPLNVCVRFLSISSIHEFQIESMEIRDNRRSIVTKRKRNRAQHVQT